MLVAGQPNGAASWFPCDDHPSSKASYRIQISTDSPYRAMANGELNLVGPAPVMTTWTYELAEPTSTYLITLQIGEYQLQRLPKTPVPMNAALPARLTRNFDHDFARQPQMMKLFVKLFGPYPLSTGYTVVVTDDDLEIPLEAQGISIFGANHCDGSRGSERLIAHELAHQWFGNSVTARRWRDIWLHEGFACYAEWLWSEESGGQTADEWARHYHQRLVDSPQDLLLSDPGPRDMFDDRVYKRGALTLHALRRPSVTTISLRCCGIGRNGTATRRRSPTTSPAWPPTMQMCRCARCGMRGCTPRTCRRCDRRGHSHRPDHPRQRRTRRHRHGAHRAVRVCGAVPRGARPRTGRLLGVRRVLGRVRVGDRRGERSAAGSHPRGALDRLRRGRVGPRTHPMRVAAMVGVVAAVVIAASSPLWSGHVFVESQWLSVALLSVGLAGFCLHATLLGMLAGVGRWTQYGALMVTDAGIRVAVAVTTFVVGWGLVGYLWATVGGAVAWLIMLIASPSTRAARRCVARRDTRSFLRGASHAIAAAGASAILVMGFPVLLKATSGDLGAAGGVVILAVTLTRAPLLVPLTAMQGNLIAHFVDKRAAAAAGPAGAGGCRRRGWARWAWRPPGFSDRGCCGWRSARNTAPSGGAARLADDGGHRDRAADVDGSGDGGGGTAPRVFGGLDQCDAGVDVVAAAAYRPGDPHGDRTALRAAGGNRGAPRRACQRTGTLTVYFGPHRYALPGCLDRRTRL